MLYNKELQKKNRERNKIKRFIWYLEKRETVRENEALETFMVVGFRPNRQVFTQKQIAVLVKYLIKCSNIYYSLTPEDVAFNCGTKYHIFMPESRRRNKEAGPD